MRKTQFAVALPMILVVAVAFGLLAPLADAHHRRHDHPTPRPTASLRATIKPTPRPGTTATPAPSSTRPSSAPTSRPTGSPSSPTPKPTIGTTPAPSPSPTARPTAAPSSSAAPGWSLVWNDQFDTWNPSNYFVYPQGWPDTTGEGVQTPGIISASGGNLLVHMQTVNGVHEVAAFCPALPGSLSNTSYGNLGDLLGMRYSFSIRADKMAGYKGVPLLWPLSEKWPRDGEIDAPESDFTAQPAAFMHHQSGTGPNDEDYYNTPAGTSWQDWHTYTIEWVPGVRVDGWIDGVHWIHDTTRIPNTPMHLVMQFETSTDGVVPAASTQGNVQIAWLQVWKYVA
jgi:hypothetical protein